MSLNHSLSDVDYDHNAVTAQEDGFAADQVNTP
jgi:hypothetical protein